MTTSTANAQPPLETEARNKQGLFASFLAGVGGPFVEIGGEVVGLFKMFFRTYTAMITQPIRWKEVWRQCFEMGNRSVFFICIVMAFLGMILVYQTGYQTEKIVGELSMLGALFLQLIFRELGPTITGTMLATRVGTGIAAEIGSMVVTEQVDALRMNNADPIPYLVVPRTIACLIMTFMLACIAVVVAFLAGMVGAKLIFDLNPRTYFNTQMLSWGDLIIFSLKSASFGAVIPIIAAHAGLTTFGGSEGVGLATTKAVVNTTLAIVMLDFVLTAVGYFTLYS